MWKKEKDSRISDKDLKKRKEEEKAKMEAEKKRQKKQEASMVIHGLVAVISELHLIAIPAVAAPAQ